MLQSKMLKDSLEFFLIEDGLNQNFNYIQNLPKDLVTCSLKFKDDLIISGIPFFFETLNLLADKEIDYADFLKLEGKEIKKNDNFEINFEISFNAVLCAERLALNLLQRSSAITTHTKKFIDKAKKIKILDTRKTTPGLRFLEKYATQIGGAFNHRFSQTDIWMIKDNHKSFFGGLEKALAFFHNMNSFYTPIVVEVHSIQELREAILLNVKHVMLDNFSAKMIAEAIKIKADGMTFEVSGGVNLSNLDSFLIEGIDAISIGSLTYGAIPVDISLKYSRSYGV